jgi:hypothetical protein
LSVLKLHKTFYMPTTNLEKLSDKSDACF